MKWIARVAPMFELVEKLIPYSKEIAEETGAAYPEDIHDPNPFGTYVIIDAVNEEEARNEAYLLMGID